MEIVRYAAKRMKEAKPIPPVEVDDRSGYAERHARRGSRPAEIPGAEVASWRWRPLHRHGLTRFINRDPETGYVNMGTYRMQVHDKNLLGIWQSPGQQGRLIAERYWKQGKSCPVVATFGGDPLLFFLSYTKFPFGVSELDRAGGMLGRPLEVIKGPLTGLPIPAHAEVVIEGEMPPPEVETHLEGPFGEWPGYYTGRHQGHRRRAAGDPRQGDILPQRSDPPQHGAAMAGRAASFGAVRRRRPVGAARGRGCPGIVGTYVHNPFFVVVAIKQHVRRPRQAGRLRGARSAAAPRATAASWWSWMRTSTHRT